MSYDYSYISAKLKPEYVQEIFALLLEGSVSPPKHDLHATIIYDERKLEEPLAKLDPKKEYRATVTDIDILGDGLVFHLSSPDLTEEFYRLKNAGYQHAFKTPLHHMSLGYDLDNYDLLALKAAFSEYGGRELIFNNTDFGFKK